MCDTNKEPAFFESPTLESPITQLCAVHSVFISGFFRFSCKRKPKHKKQRKSLVLSIALNAIICHQLVLGSHRISRRFIENRFISYRLKYRSGTHFSCQHLSTIRTGTSLTSGTPKNAVFSRFAQASFASGCCKTAKNDSAVYFAKSSTAATFATCRGMPCFGAGLLYRNTVIFDRLA